MHCEIRSERRPLANAIVMSVMQQAPFNPATDPARTCFYFCVLISIDAPRCSQVGVSYVSIFTVCYHVVFWMCGAAQSLSWDYLPAVPQGQDAERRLSWKEKPIGRLVARALHLPPAVSQPSPFGRPPGDEERSASASIDDKGVIETIEHCVPTADIPRIVVIREGEERRGASDETPADIADVQLTPRAPTHRPAAATVRSHNLTLVIPPSPLRPNANPVPPSPLRTVMAPATPGFATAPSSPVRGGVFPLSPIRSLAPSTATRAISVAGSLRSLAPDTPLPAVHAIHSLEDPVKVASLSEKAAEAADKRRACAGVRDTLAPLLKPVTVSLAVSIPVALVQPLKALFIDCTATGCPAWHGPDGRPVLAFVMDTGECSDFAICFVRLLLRGLGHAAPGFWPSFRDPDFAIH